MIQHVRTTTSITISEETDRRLDILKAHLNSPKSWIVRRLVDEELEKQGINLNSNKRLKVEVRAK